MRQHLTSIVAIDRQGAIGCDNRLPWALKTDMAFFRKTTMQQAVIMGRKTYDSIGGCLKGRRNVILSRKAELYSSSEDCRFVPTKAYSLLAAMESGAEEAFVIGGAATYLEFADLVDRYIITFVDHDAELADAYFSNSILTEIEGWKSEEIGVFPACEGRDQFSFRIRSFDAPNVSQRHEMRAKFIKSAGAARARAIEQRVRRTNLAAKQVASVQPV
jgi:dihydrofolate reductase